MSGSRDAFRRHRANRTARGRKGRRCTSRTGWGWHHISARDVLETARKMQTTNEHVLKRHEFVNCRVK